MSRLYGPIHRSLQDRFDTRRLADNVERRVVLTKIPQEHKAFIESRDMFFLSTIDHQGRPTVSYKGGDPGFVRVLDSKTLAFPCYDGNGIPSWREQGRDEARELLAPVYGCLPRASTRLI